MMDITAFEQIKLDRSDRALVNEILDSVAENPEAAAWTIVALRSALHKIAYAPFGPADASPAHVLEEITNLARATLEAQP